MTTTLNVELIMGYMERQATKAVMAATNNAVGKAKKHAPVRKIFRGTTYHAGKSGFREPITRQLTTPRGIGASLDPKRGFLDKVGPSTEEAGERIRGHANSSTPLLRNRVGRTSVLLSGDFRRINPSTGRLAKLEPRDVTAVEVRNGKVTPINVPRAVSGEDIRVAGGKRALTNRGKYEIRSGRANVRGADGVTRVGGRLRDEIHAEGPFTEKGVIWGYVVSATKDPVSGRLYPRDQEFGTVHHPPHPFLRPALHESRGNLRAEIRNAIRKGPQS